MKIFYFDKNKFEQLIEAIESKNTDKALVLIKNGVNINRVCGFLYVFHPDALEEGLYTYVNGMDLGFIVCYRFSYSKQEIQKL